MLPTFLSVRGYHLRAGTVLHGVTLHAVGLSVSLSEIVIYDVLGAGAFAAPCTAGFLVIKF